MHSNLGSLMRELLWLLWATERFVAWLKRINNAVNERGKTTKNVNYTSTSVIYHFVISQMHYDLFSHINLERVLKTCVMVIVWMKSGWNPFLMMFAPPVRQHPVHSMSFRSYVCFSSDGRWHNRPCNRTTAAAYVISTVISIKFCDFISSTKWQIVAIEKWHIRLLCPVANSCGVLKGYGHSVIFFAYFRIILSSLKMKRDRLTERQFCLTGIGLYMAIVRALWAIVCL